MKLCLVFAIAAALLLPGRAIPVTQAGVPCYHDWATAPRQHFMIADGAEYKQIVAACRQQRADTVPWDQYLQMFQTAANMRALAGDAQANLLRLIEMVRKERDHLRAAPSPPASRSGSDPVRGGSNVRTTDIGPMINRPIEQPDRFAIALEFRSWVPQLARDMVAARLQTNVRLLGFQGDATVRRGDRIARLSEIVRKGELLSLQSGDIFEARGGSIDLEIDGAVFTVTPRTTVMIGYAECLTTWKDTSAPYQRMISMHLIDGILMYATTTHEVRARCVVAARGVAIGVRGTSFLATHRPNAQGGSLEVEVSSGSVVVEDKATQRTWTLNGGERRTIQYSVASTPPATAPSQYAWDVQNNCRYDVDFKLFELNARDEITGSWKTVPLAAGDRTKIPIRPTPGGKVCWGADSRQGNLRWGLGLDGEGTCDRCCSETLAATAAVTRTANLTCPGK